MILISVLILQLVFFGLMMYFLKRIFGKNIATATKHIDELNQETMMKKEEANKRLAEVKMKSENIVAKAQEDAKKMMSGALLEAASEREKIVAAAREQAGEIMRQAERSREQLISDMEERVAAASIQRACDLMSEVLPEQLKKSVHAQWVRDLIRDGFDHLKSVRIPDGIREVGVVSAFDLTDDERKTLASKVKSVLGANIDIREKTDPRLVAGIVLTAGSLVLDGSLKNKIEEKAKKVG